MGLLQDPARAMRWYDLVSPVYEPWVAETFWPSDLQRAALDRLDLASGDRVLDVGCGTGRTARLLEERAGTVVGLDASAPQLARAARRPSLADTVLVRGDGGRLPFAADSFAAVVSVGAIIYFPDPEAALADARRVTRAGGEVLVVGLNDLDRAPRTPLEGWAQVATAAYFGHYDRAGAATLFEAAGWEAVESAVTGPAWHPELAIVTTATAPE